MSDLIPYDHGGDLLWEARQVLLQGRNPATQRAYAQRVDEFLDWRDSQDPAPLIAHLRGYMAYLQDERGLAPRTIQNRLSTIKRLIKYAAALDPRLTAGLPQLDLVEAPTVRGQIQGKRYTAAQLQRLLEQPGTDTLLGLRDTIALALMGICGLRRSEVVNLSWGHLQELDGFPCIVNLKSKHGRVRTIKLPRWLWDLTWAWGSVAGLDTAEPSAAVLRPFKTNGQVWRSHKRLSPEALYHRLDYLTTEAGLPKISPHDLRRTAALLSRRGGASIEQVQVMLGHASPQTTSEYIGEEFNAEDNAVDYSPIEDPTR